MENETAKRDDIEVWRELEKGKETETETPRRSQQHIVLSLLFVRHQFVEGKE